MIDKKFLTYEKFSKIPPGNWISTGTIVDSPGGINMTNSGKMLSFVAVKGYADDWALYVFWETDDLEYVARSGDKVSDKENILRAVQCDEEVLAKYRR